MLENSDKIYKINHILFWIMFFLLFIFSIFITYYTDIWFIGLFFPVPVMIFMFFVYIKVLISKNILIIVSDEYIEYKDIISKGYKKIYYKDIYSIEEFVGKYPIEGILVSLFNKKRIVIDLTYVSNCDYYILRDILLEKIRILKDI